MIPHFYQSIEPDWFDYEELYLRMVQEASNGAHFVEVGSHRGRSAAYMAVEIANSGKKIQFDCIDCFDFYDTFEKSPEFFHHHLKPVDGYYNLVVGRSPGIANRYADESLDFVWIDAAHKYEDVTADIGAWYPKVKKGGYIGGHDWPGDPTDISDAVKDHIPDWELFQYRLTTSWLHRKPL